MAEAAGNGRTALQCFRKWRQWERQCDMAEAHRGQPRATAWTEEEDAALAAAVGVFGDDNYWEQVAQNIPGRPFSRL